MWSQCCCAEESDDDAPQEADADARIHDGPPRVGQALHDADEQRHADRYAPRHRLPLLGRVEEAHLIEWREQLVVQRRASAAER